MVDQSAIDVRRVVRSGDVHFSRQVTDKEYFTCLFVWWEKNRFWFAWSIRFWLSVAPAFATFFILVALAHIDLFRFGTKWSKVDRQELGHRSRIPFQFDWLKVAKIVDRKNLWGSHTWSSFHFVFGEYSPNDFGQNWLVSPNWFICWLWDVLD